MPRKKYTLDQILRRAAAREELRKLGVIGNFKLKGPGGEGGWNEAKPEDKNNWNLTDEDIKDIDETLQSDSVFSSDLVITEETTLEQANDSVGRMKRGDCSKFNHLPQFLREYYGRKSLMQLFGTDKEIPELNDEMKKKLDKFLMRPEFRYVVAKLIERNAKDQSGNSMTERLMEYDKYLNQRLLAKTLDPISSQNLENLKNKYPADKVDSIIKQNKEKQVFIAKTIFMAQLGRTDIITGAGENKTVEPFTGSISELFSHGGRVMFTLPRGDDAAQEKMFNSWRKSAIDSKVLQGRTFASHDTRRRHVDDDGGITLPAEELRYKWQEQLQNRQFTKKPTTMTHNSGMNIALGGLGREFNGRDCVDGDGAFGHIYMKVKQGDTNRCGSLLIGIENASPKKESCIGQMHNFKAISHDMSSFFSGKTTVGNVIGGREIDLSHLTADEFSRTMDEFEAGYRKLMEDAEYDDDMRKKLIGINNKLCGKAMSAIELAAVMTTLGIQKKEAVHIAEAGRSVKDAAYTAERYPEEMQRIVDPNQVDERECNPDFAVYIDEIRGMSAYVDSMRRQWNQMVSHTWFDAWNSSEFKNMDKAVSNYLKAYDNLMAGKTVDGKKLRANSGHLTPDEYDKLRSLETKMVKAGRKYHNDKVKQKKGGFEKHKTDQARDRDAMSMLLSSFSLDARREIKELEPAPQNMTSREKRQYEQVKNKEARDKLDERVNKLMGR